ncbi:mucin-2-like [Thrips palmi]|uniref:Mucin-2-like n=1 Tax=Thrips palmi TaxID=161013 RepID=A0A6P9A0B0_THRPL|nr:mucin-2-like [Thrips palmi]
MTTNVSGGRFGVRWFPLACAVLCLPVAFALLASPLRSYNRDVNVKGVDWTSVEIVWIADTRLNYSVWSQAWDAKRNAYQTEVDTRVSFWIESHYEAHADIGNLESCTAYRISVKVFDTSGGLLQVVGTVDVFTFDGSHEELLVTDVVAVPVNGSAVRVSWVPPSWSELPAPVEQCVEGYTVAAKRFDDDDDDDEVETVFAKVQGIDSSEATVEGLLPCITYSLEVVATFPLSTTVLDSYGPSQMENVSVAMPGSQPSEPRNLQIKTSLLPTGKATICMTWQPPLEMASCVSHYQVTLEHNAELCMDHYDPLPPNAPDAGITEPPTTTSSDGPTDAGTGNFKLCSSPSPTMLSRPRRRRGASVGTVGMLPDPRTSAGTPHTSRRSPEEPTLRTPRTPNTPHTPHTSPKASTSHDSTTSPTWTWYTPPISPTPPTSTKSPTTPSSPISPIPPTSTTSPTTPSSPISPTPPTSTKSPTSPSSPISPTPPTSTKSPSPPSSPISPTPTTSPISLNPLTSPTCEF